MAGSSGQALAPAVASASKGPLPKYCVRLGEAASVDPCVVQKIFEHFRSMAIDSLQQMKPFSLHSIASFRRHMHRARPASTKKIQGRAFKTKPLPATRRVNCTVTSTLECTVLSAAPSNPKSPTPIVAAQCQKLATSIGDQDITSDMVGKVVTALRNAIIQDLRAKGTFVLDGIVRFVRVDIKARPAQYSQIPCGKLALFKAKGPHRRVYGRAPRRIKINRGGGPMGPRVHSSFLSS